MRRAEAVVVELVKIVGLAQSGPFGLVVAAVVEAFVVFGPRSSGELYPLQIVGKIFAGVDVADVPLGPVGAGGGDGVGHELAIVGYFGISERDRAVGGERVGIEQDARLGG